MTRIEDLQKQVDEKIKELERQGEEEKKNKEIKKMINEIEKDKELKEIIEEAEALSKEVKENTPKEEKKEEPIKHSPLSIVSLITSILLPPLGIILSIISIVMDKKKKNKDNLSKFSLILGLVMLVVLSSISTIFYLEYKDNKELEKKKTTTTTAIITTEKTTTTTAIKEKAGAKFYLISRKDITDSPYYYVTPTLSTDNYNSVLSTYTCKSTPCSYYVIGNNTNIVILDDNEYFLYNFKSAQKIKTLNLDASIYYSNILITEDENKIYGYELYSKSDKFEGTDFHYYDEDQGRITFDVLCEEDWDSPYLLKKIPNITNQIVVFTQKYSKIKAYNYTTKAKLFEIGGNGDQGDIISINGKTYYKLVEVAKYGFPGFKKLFDENFNLIINTPMTNIIALDDNGFVTYDDNYTYKYRNDELIYKSEYYERIYKIYDDYFIAKIKNEVYVLDYNNEKIAKLFDIKKNMTVNEYYVTTETINNQYVITLVVSDPEATCDEIDIDFINNFYGEYYSFNKDNCKKDSNKGYVYYYVPSTEKTFKKAIIIEGTNE